MSRAVLCLILLAGCGSSLPRHLVLSADDSVGYPCVLHAPAEWTGDFMVRQSLSFRTRYGKGDLDAVLQKQGETLTLVGLGPLNERAFTLSQRGKRIEFTQYVGPALPFSPRNILVDVHRVYFKGLPAPAAADYSGVMRGELDGESVEERWDQGELRERAFTRPGSELRGVVRIDYGAGCRPGRCEPASVTLRNEWYDYTLDIASHEYEAL